MRLMQSMAFRRFSCARSVLLSLTALLVAVGLTQAWEIGPQYGPAPAPVRLVVVEPALERGASERLCRGLRSALALGYNVTLLSADWAAAWASESAAAGSFSADLAALPPKLAILRQWLSAREALLDARRQRVDAPPLATSGGMPGARPALWEDAEVMVVLEAAAALLQLPPRAMGQAFAKLANKSHPVVASAEQNCWPLAGRQGMGALCSAAPQSPLAHLFQEGGAAAAQSALGLQRGAQQLPPGHPPRWLSAGCFAGTPRSLSQLLQSLASGSERNSAGVDQGEPSRPGEQEVLLRAFLQGDSGIQLDYSGAMCLAAHHAANELALLPLTTQGGGVWRDTRRTTVPAAIHAFGEGLSADVPRPMWASLMYSSLPSLPGTLEDGTGHPVDLSRWCIWNNPIVQ